VYAQADFGASIERSTLSALVVGVDFELRGCPIDKNQLLEVLAAELQGRRPRVATHSVCVECKARGNVCVTIAHGTPCLGPVTQAGCGALCPTFARGCYGCFGPQDSPNTASMAQVLSRHGMDEPQIVRLYRTFNAAAEAFREESERHEAPAGTPRRTS
jgi:coenzyme F420-reducing hydrogenase gamma subunit